MGYRKVGGLHFIRAGRINASFSLSKAPKGDAVGTTAMKVCATFVASFVYGLIVF